MGEIVRKYRSFDALNILLMNSNDKLMIWWCNLRDNTFAYEKMFEKWTYKSTKTRKPRFLGNTYSKSKKPAKTSLVRDKNTAKATLSTLIQFASTLMWKHRRSCVVSTLMSVETPRKCTSYEIDHLVRGQVCLQIRFVSFSRFNGHSLMIIW